MYILILGSQTAQNLLISKLNHSPSNIIAFETLEHYLDSDSYRAHIHAVFDCYGNSDTYIALAMQNAIDSQTYYFVNLLGKAGLAEFLSQIQTNTGILNSNNIFSFGGADFFLKSQVLEIGSGMIEKNKADAEDFFLEHKINACLIPDHASGFGPRVVCMIINEAYLVIEQQITDTDSVDLAMKLGANYPDGPFEWCKQISPNLVCLILDSAYNESKDERYKTCALLESEGKHADNKIISD